MPVQSVYFCVFETKSNVLQYEYQVFRSKGIAGWCSSTDTCTGKGKFSSSCWSSCSTGWGRRLAWSPFGKPTIRRSRIWLSWQIRPQIQWKFQWQREAVHGSVPSNNKFKSAGVTTEYPKFLKALPEKEGSLDTQWNIMERVTSGTTTPPLGEFVCVTADSQSCKTTPPLRSLLDERLWVAGYSVVYRLKSPQSVSLTSHFIFVRSQVSTLFSYWW